MFWYRLRWKLVRSYLPKGREFELVDVGAGAGFLGDYLKKDRPLATYRFVEPIDSLRAILCQKFGTNACCDLDKGLQGAQFVTLLDVLEHQEHDYSFLEEFVTRLRPGSKILLTVPALQSLWSSWDDVLGHFRRYDRQSLLKVMEDLPLDIDEASYLFPELLPFGWLRAHFRPSRMTSDAKYAEGEAELPRLPTPLNEALYAFGSVSLSLRKHWSRGTSLFVGATRVR